MSDLKITPDNSTPFYVAKELTPQNTVTDEKHVADQTKKIANSPGMLETVMSMPHVQQKIVEHLTGIDVERLRETNTGLQEQIPSINQMLEALQLGKLSDQLAGEYSRLIATYFNAVLEQKLTAQEITALQQTQGGRPIFNGGFLELKTCYPSAVNHRQNRLSQFFAELNESLIDYVKKNKLSDDNINIILNKQWKGYCVVNDAIMFLSRGGRLSTAKQFFALSQHFFDSTEKDENRAMIAVMVAKLVNYLTNHSPDKLNAQHLAEISQPYATLEAIGHAVYWHLARQPVDNSVMQQ